MRKIVSFCTLLMFMTMLAIAQTRPIMGRVLDEAGQPVSGASITIRGTNAGASADADGNFSSLKLKTPHYLPKIIQDLTVEVSLPYLLLFESK